MPEMEDPTRGAASRRGDPGTRAADTAPRRACRYRFRRQPRDALAAAPPQCLTVLLRIYACDGTVAQRTEGAESAVFLRALQQQRYMEVMAQALAGAPM